MQLPLQGICQLHALVAFLVLSLGLRKQDHLPCRADARQTGLSSAQAFHS
jgi:hypothetical protein